MSRHGWKKTHNSTVVNADRSRFSFVAPCNPPSGAFHGRKLLGWGLLLSLLLPFAQIEAVTSHALLVESTTAIQLSSTRVFHP